MILKEVYFCAVLIFIPELAVPELAAERKFNDSGSSCRFYFPYLFPGAICLGSAECQSMFVILHVDHWSWLKVPAEPAAAEY